MKSQYSQHEDMEHNEAVHALVASVALLFFVVVGTLIVLSETFASFIF